MVKPTQTICRQIADELFEFDHFVKLALKRLIFSYEIPLQRIHEIMTKLHSYRNQLRGWFLYDINIKIFYRLTH